MKIEVDMGETRIKKVRDLEAIREVVKQRAVRARNVENDLYSARLALEDATKALAKAESEAAAEFLLAVLPLLDAPQPAPDLARVADGEKSNG